MSKDAEARLKKFADLLWAEECALALLEGDGDVGEIRNAYIIGYKAALESWKKALDE